MQTQAENISAYKAFKIPAKIVSYVLHPLFIPTFIFFWLTYRFPMKFEGITAFALLMRKINVFWMTAFFPAFSVFLLWRLKLIDNIFLRTQRERIAPYIITMIFYWWMWYLSRNFPDQPYVLRFFYLGIFFATIIGLTANNFFKISMHAMGIGGALCFIILTCSTYGVFLGIDIVVATVIAGLVCSSRLLLNHHSNFEVYAGFFTGVFCQVITYWIVM
ncbi:MAG: hypothetical protein ACTHJ5_18360 [Ilyomonas sp.]